jgi:hypothetical protein
VASNANFIPPLTTNADDAITLGYGVIGLMVLSVFRQELFAARASSALLVAGAAASAVMLGADAFGAGFLGTLELPAQISAVAFLLLATAVRYREVGTAVVERERCAELAAPVWVAGAGASAVAVMAGSALARRD